MQHFQVPVIAVFTKYDQFKFNVEMDVFDDPDKYPDSDASQVAEKLFEEHYLRPLGDGVKYVRLESVLRVNIPRTHTDGSAAEMDVKDSRCDNLVEETAAALNENTVALMLLVVQKNDLNLSVKTALRR